MAGEVDICNRALQKLGASRIQTMLDNTPNAKSCNFIYDHILESELRKHVWSCATKRAQLPALGTDPLFGKDKAYELPADFIRLLPPDPEWNTNTHDWVIEGNKIVTNDTAPLKIRYIYKLEDVSQMDPLFRETLAAAIALELCEEITQSNTKKRDLFNFYRETINQAKRVNAIERPAQEIPESSWITKRS